MRKAMDRDLALRLLVLAVPFLLAGCAITGTYRDLVRDFEENGDTSYYRQATATATLSYVPVAPAASDSLDSGQRRLMETKQRWEATLDAPSTAQPRDGTDQPDLRLYRNLAHDPSLDQRLGDGIELDTLLGLLGELNPSVLAAREALRATLEQYPQAAYLDNILKQYNAFTKQLDTKIGPQQHKGMMAMAFPFPDALALKGKIVSEEVEIAARQHEIALRDARAAMSTAYHAYTFVSAAIVINRENQGLLEQMITVAEAKIRVGKARYSAVIMAQVELSKLKDDIITLEEQRGTLAARINTLLSRAPDAALGAPDPVADVAVDLPLEALYDMAVRDRQELQQQRLRISKMETTAELATRMAYPDATTGASYLENRTRLTDGTDQTAPAFMTQRDLNHRETPWFGERDATIREIKTRVGALKNTLMAMENDTRFEVKQAYFALDSAKRSIDLYQQSLLPQAQQALEVTSADYRSGQADFLTFLDAQRTLLKFQLAEHAARRDHRTQLARLEQLAGHSLPRRPFPPETHIDK